MVDHTSDVGDGRVAASLEAGRLPPREVVVYLLGPPGGGKSAAGDMLGALAAADGWSVHRRGDLPIIGSMIKAEDEWRADSRASRRERRRRGHARRFRRTTYGSFDILDVAVFSEAFQILQTAIRNEIRLVADEGRHVFVVELARVDLRRRSWPTGITNESVIQSVTFGRLGAKADILFIEAPLEERIARIEMRFAPGVENRHYISAYAFNTHYPDVVSGTVPPLKESLDRDYCGFLVGPHLEHFVNRTGEFASLVRTVTQFWEVSKARSEWAAVLNEDPMRILHMQQKIMQTRILRDYGQSVADRVHGL